MHSKEKRKRFFSTLEEITGLGRLQARCMMSLTTILKFFGDMIIPMSVSSKD
jgi:hypothetical protein